MSQASNNSKQPSSWIAPVTLWRCLKAAIGKTAHMDVSMRCAGVAFFTFLSFFPALGAAIAITGLLFDTQDLALSAGPLGDALPTDIVEIIEMQIGAFLERDTTFGISLVISLLVAAWTGSRGMNALIYAVNMAYAEVDERSFGRSLLVSLAATLIAIITLIVMVFTVAVLPTIAGFLPLPEAMQALILTLRWPVIAAFIFACLFLLYRNAPHQKGALAHIIWPGALIGTLLWLLGSVLLSWFIENFGQYEATFGSIAAIAIFMLWLNVTALAFVFGAMFNTQLEHEVIGTS